MDEAELLQLLLDMESDRVEPKRAESDREKIREAVCAFANDMPDHRKPGVLFVGVNDDGTCAGIPITDQLLLTLSDIRSNSNILPPPMMTVQKRNLNGCEMAVVIVEPADAPPVRYNGRVWIRVGPRRATATVQEERRLAERRRAGDLPFDLRPVVDSLLDDLDLDLFERDYLPTAVAPDVIEANERTMEQKLTALRFLTPPPASPTVLGVLSIGKDPRAFLPGAYVQFVRIDGTELTDPIRDQREIGGPLPDLLHELDNVLEAHITSASSITAASIEAPQPDYPLRALQQLTRNAVLHRTYEATNAPARINWYNDRVEIQNPGGLFGMLTPENFGQPGITDYRNPHIAEVMKNLGYVQRFGWGIPIAESEMKKNGNPPLEFTPGPHHFLVVLRRRP